MLTNRSTSAAEATGRSFSYQGQQSLRQLCLPSAEDGRKIRQVSKQNSFHEDQTVGYNGPQVIDRRFRDAPAAYHSENHIRLERNKMAAAPSRLPAGGGGGGLPPMSTSWTSAGDGISDDVPGAWRQFRNSERSLRCSGLRLNSAKFASSLELSLDNDGSAKGSEPQTSTLFASPSATGGAGGGSVGGTGGVGGGNMGAEAGRYFYHSNSPGTQTELARIFENPIDTPSHPARPSERVLDTTHLTLFQNGTTVLPSGPLESSTAGSYPELNNISLNESRRGSLPAPRKLNQTSPTAILRVRKENPYENSASTSNRQRNESNIYRSNSDSDHQNGNGNTFSNFHDGNSFKSSGNGNSFVNSDDGNRFWSVRNGTSASKQDRYVDGTARENIYEEIDNSSLRSSRSGISLKLPPAPLTTATDAIQSGGYRGPVMSLRLTPDQFTLSNSTLSSRHRLFSSTRSIHKSFDDGLSQEYPNPRNRAQAVPPVHSTGSSHANPDARCHPRPFSRNPDDTVGASRMPDRVPRGVPGPAALGVASDGYLEPVTLTQPLDVTVARLEALLQEKDGERRRLQAAMEDKEKCLIKQLRLEKRNSELRLVELVDEWNRRLACHQQKAFRIEQSLLSQIYKLRTEKKTVKEQLDRLRLENEALEGRVERLESNLRTSTANEAQLQALNNEKQEELEHLRVQLMNATAPLPSNAATKEDLNSEPTGTQPATADRGTEAVKNDAGEREEETDRLRLSSPKSNEEDEEEEEEVENENNEEAQEEDTSAPLSTICRQTSSSGSGSDEIIRRLEVELKETRIQLMEAEHRMRTDQEQWLDEKKKVIAYQKQLQLNYIQMVQRNKLLQQETHQLALELERQHIRQVDAEALASPAPLANADVTTCADVT